jgi:hypothetical protein
MWKRSQPILRANSQMRRVRQASMLARAAPLSDFVTDTPKKLKKAMLITVVAVVHCSVQSPRTSCVRSKANTNSIRGNQKFSRQASPHARHLQTALDLCLTAKACCRLSSGKPSGPRTCCRRGSARQQRETPQKPSRPTASSTGALYCTRYFSSKMN